MASSPEADRKFRLRSQRLRDRRELPVRARLRRAGDAEHAAALDAPEASQGRSAQRSAGRPQLGTAGSRAARPQPVRIPGRSDRAARRRGLHHLRQRRLLRAGAATARGADRQPLRASTVLEQGDTAIEAERHADPRPEDRRPARAAMDRLARRPGSIGRRPARRNADASAAMSPTAPRPNARWPRPAITPTPPTAPSRASLRWRATKFARPLNGIIGMSGLLLDTPLTPEQMTYAKAVKTSGDALLSLIEELLDYSKIEAGKIDLEHRPFALAALIEDITELLAPRAQARKLEIAAYVDERLPMRSGRRRRAAAAGAAQSGRQRHQVHLDRRRGADCRARHLAERNQLPGARHRHRHRAGSAASGSSASSNRPTSASRRNYGGTGLGLEHQRAHRQAHGRPHHAGKQARRRLDLRGVDSARRRRRKAASNSRSPRPI